MKPKEMKTTEVYRIIDRKSNTFKGSYSRACCDEYDFTSVNEARRANVHGMFEDKGKYKISKYKVTYKLIKDDCDGAEKVPLKEERSNDSYLTEKEKDLSFNEMSQLILDRRWQEMLVNFTQRCVEEDNKKHKHI